MRPTWGANRGRIKAGPALSFRGHPIEVGRTQRRMTITPKIAITLIVSKNHDEIGRAVCAAGVAGDAATNPTATASAQTISLRMLRIVFPIHPSPEDPAAERAEPTEHVVHVAEIHQLDQVAVEVLGEEERVAAR